MLEILPYLIPGVIAVVVFTLLFKANWIYTPAILVPAFLVLWGIYALGAVSKTSDTEIWNGQVTGKTSERVSCSHSYKCMCFTTTDSKGNSTEHCSTCYEHSYDVDWDVQTTIGGYSINRIDSQGLIQPERWSSVNVNDPVSTTKSFTNYVRGVDFSIFSRDPENVTARWKGKLPAYPDAVYDYYHIDRVIPIGMKLSDQGVWNDHLQNMLKDIGPSKQVNAVVVMVNSDDTTFADALNTAWVGAKKNDVVLVMGTPHYPEVLWVRVVSWTPNNIFKINLRHRIEDLKTLNPDAVVSTMRDEIIKTYKRRHMKDFAYLKSEIVPEVWVIWFMWILGIIGVPGVAFFVLRNFAETEDEFTNNRNSWR